MIAGFDGIPAAGWQGYDLTTFEQDAEAMVAHAVGIVTATAATQRSPGEIGITVSPPHRTRLDRGEAVRRGSPAATRTLSPVPSDARMDYGCSRNATRCRTLIKEYRICSVYCDNTSSKGRPGILRGRGGRGGRGGGGPVRLRLTWLIHPATCRQQETYRQMPETRGAQMSDDPTAPRHDPGSPPSPTSITSLRRVRRDKPLVRIVLVFRRRIIDGDASGRQGMT